MRPVAGAGASVPQPRYQGAATPGQGLGFRVKGSRFRGFKGLGRIGFAVRLRGLSTGFGVLGQKGLDTANWGFVLGALNPST